MLRYTYLHRRSIPRVMEIFFWPLMNLLVWGFVTLYMRSVAVPGAVLFLLGGVIFWDILYRSQQAISLTITEELWVRNIINLFVAPIRPGEIVAAACIVGVFKAVITTVFLTILAFALYDFNMAAMGLALVPFFLNLLVFGWAVGMITMAVIFRFGRASEALIWGVPFLIQPLSAVFYPLDVLPVWLQPVSLILPSTYVFEGMRAALDRGVADTRLLAAAASLNVLWLAGAAFFFALMLKKVRERGYLGRQVLD